mmetsp:Transcript_78766/g.132183  ORF Transcript_78766/g.132183 Transcript_78766/m.132183 type:complete len:208 (+) Transcript_78766:1120-1743(+)
MHDDLRMGKALVDGRLEDRQLVAFGRQGLGDAADRGLLGQLCHELERHLVHDNAFFVQLLELCLDSVRQNEIHREFEGLDGFADCIGRPRAALWHGLCDQTHMRKLTVGPLAVVAVSTRPDTDGSQHRVHEMAIHPVALHAPSAGDVLAGLLVDRNGADGLGGGLRSRRERDPVLDGPRGGALLALKLVRLVQGAAALTDPGVHGRG